jgi:hypothetical protein
VSAKVAHCTKRWPALQKPPILAEGTKVGPSRLQGGSDRRMASIEEPITIKGYGNSRLYNARAGSSVSLQDLASKVEDDNEFVVHDVKSGEDITTIVLKQIIAERVHHG